MITKEKLVELIYSCQSATVSTSDTVTSIIKEAGVSSCIDITDPIRRYKERGSGLEKCVDEVYEILNNSCNGCTGYDCSDGFDPCGQSRFENPELILLIKFLKKEYGINFDINKLEEAEEERAKGLDCYRYENKFYEVSDLYYILEDVRLEKLDLVQDEALAKGDVIAFDDAEIIVKNEIEEILEESTDPLKELSLIMGYEDIKEVGEDLIIIRKI